MNGWGDWSVGSSQFVELPATPTKSTLWFLLGRRTARVFPRNQKEADLIIPIFCRSTSEVSFIVVQVKNKGEGDENDLQSALGQLTPANLFKSYIVDKCGAADLFLLCLRGMSRRPKEGSTSLLGY
ncbi:hypothetical protein JG688_00008513 [Phytophthora aleatoria]|uniref:Uncharacterized protein n=1 Tax=Phytophthora aleatoria TaxID=2496075 RepID=A0A8J5ING1_9STRA|nr:hypothetical protein JG688_00008513 [Phytophthora aleatoria]